jgi:tRNA-splicing ligase RtcB
MTEVNKLDKNIYEIGKSGKMNVPVRIYASEKLLKDMKKDNCLEQGKNVAMLPGIQKFSIVLPDAHQGYGFSIGGVAAFDIEKGIISPGGVGYDINCLSKNSRILNEFGYWKRIEEFNLNSKESNLITFNKESLEENQSEINLFMKKYSEKIINIKTKYGLNIIATEDHPFYTKNGMNEMKRISENEEILVYPFEGVEYEKPDKFLLVDEKDINRLDISTTSKLQIIKKLKSLGLLPLYSNNEKLPLILKIMGHNFGDGSLIMGKNPQIQFYGKKEDLELIKKDIEKIGLKCSIFSRKRIHKMKTSYKEYTFSRIEHYLKSNSNSFGTLLFLLGTPRGNKAEQDYCLPEWLMKLKKWQKRLFISSLFGAELSSPKSVTGCNLNLYSLILSLNKRNSYHGLKFVNQISVILESFGVNSVLIKSREDELNGTRSTRIRLMISARPENLIKFFSTINYEYNIKKRKLANAAALWLKYKFKIKELRDKAKVKAREMRVLGYNKKQIFDELNNAYINEAFLEKSMYNENYGKSGSRIAYCFITFNEFVKNNCYGDSGFIWDEIESKSEESYNDYVYDFTINKNHNFIANSFVVSNCSVRLLATNLKKENIDRKRNEISKSLFNAIPTGVGKGSRVKINNEEMKEILEKGAKWAVGKGYGEKRDYEFTEESGCMIEADSSCVSKEAISRGLNQLGSLGAGNHFLEVQYVDEIFDKKIAGVFGLEKGQVCIMIHCGSRGLGHQVASDYMKLMSDKYGFENLPDRQLINAPINSELGKNYYKAMSAAANFAFCNKQVLTHLTREAMKKFYSEFKADVVYDVCHNIAKFEEHEIDGKKVKLCVHRKGATRSFGPGRKEIPLLYRDVGQPVIIPGSMGTASYVLVGTKKAEELSFSSTAHGAGRVMSRHEAMKKFKSEEVKKDLEKKNISVTAGSWKSLVEEGSEVYKDIDEVVKVSHELGMGNLVARLKPIVVIKG